MGEGLKRAFAAARASRKRTREQGGERRPPMCEEWQPIETAPLDGTVVLTFTPSRNPQIATMFWANPGTIQNKWCCEDGSWYVKGPTHWMPLPDPPR